MSGSNKLKHASGNGVTISAPSSNPAADRTLALPSNADGTILTTTFPKTGNIIQVQEFTKSDVVSAQPSSTFTDISGFTTSITPSSTSSKILVIVMIFAVGGDTTALRLIRDSTSILQGDTVSGKEPVSAGVYQGNASNGSNYYSLKPSTLTKLDAPSTTSAVTYKMQWKASNASNVLYLNRNISDTNQYAFRTVSTITLMEVAG